jgi:SAM-dependent methyltransferase
MSDIHSKIIEQLTKHYDEFGAPPNWAARHYRKLLAHYYSHCIPKDASVLEIGCGQGILLSLLPNRDVAGIDLSPKQIEAAKKNVPHGCFEVGAGENFKFTKKYDYILISDTINFAADVQRIFENMHQAAHEETRVCLNFFNHFWKPFVSLGVALGFKAKQKECNWLSVSDVRSLLSLCGWKTITQRGKALIPLPLFGLDRLINRYLAPLVDHFCLTIFMVARKEIINPQESRPSVSIIIPARNEEGNIEQAVLRIPKMTEAQEIVFVEGNSKDGTWAKIQEVQAKYPDQKIQIMQQEGIGKGDAVRKGFAAAKGDILMILDADLTVSPEELPKFYCALASGRAEFANGVRLVYPMENEAMRFFNLIANKFFSLAFSWLLNQTIKDTLCGTKVLRKKDYEKIVRERAYFGDFDPFGDFDLIFGACRQNMEIVDIPIRYCNRTYGETNIQRWKHGWLLLKMMVFAARKIKFL